MLFSLTLIPPLLVEEYYRDGSLPPFVFSILFFLGAGFILYFPFRKHKKELRSRDGFLIVVLFWVVASLAGALPFYLAKDPNMSFTDAFFESVSGFTTTGSTVLTGLDTLPHSILYYRQQTQLLGGMGIIILAVAILPMLGIGGMQLYRAESTGPVKDNKLTPRIAQTAKAIWAIYIALALLCAICFWASGMNFFDAIGHSFAAVSTGGYSTHDLSLGYYHEPLIKIVAIIFMFLGSISFNLHFAAIHNRNGGIYRRDSELRAFIIFLCLFWAATWVGFLIFNPPSSEDLLLDTIFQVVSIHTTTGFVTTDFSLWPAYIPLMLLFAGVIGGCAGSTSGGLKVVRLLLLMKQGNREVHRLVHPQGFFTIKFGNLQVPNRVIEAIWGFLAMYICIFTIFLLLLLLTEMDFITAYSALLTTISNTGPGLGKITANFAELSNFSKWILSFAMLVGRLEIFTVIVLFSPALWRS